MSQGDRGGGDVAEGELPIDSTQQAPETGFAKNQVELAAAIDYDRKTIQRWLKIEGCPGAKSDGRYDIEAWKKWIHDTRRGHGKKEGKTKVDIETQIAELKREGLELEMKKIRGQLMDVDEVCQVMVGLFAGTVGALRTLRHEVATQVVGVSVAEATKRLGNAQDAVLEKLSLGEWAKKKAFWSTVSARLSALQQKLLPSTGP